MVLLDKKVSGRAKNTPKKICKAQHKSYHYFCFTTEMYVSSCVQIYFFWKRPEKLKRILDEK